MNAPFLLTIGETMAMFYGDRVGTFAHLTTAAVGIGGAESNVAIAAARLGAATHWVGRVGDDSLGIRVLRELRAEGIEVHATTDAGAPTGLMIKERPTSSGSRVRYHRSGSAGSRLEPADLPLDALRTSSVLHVTGITPALSSSAAETIEAAVSAARDAGALVSFDVNHRARLWSRERAVPVYRGLAATADLVFAGFDEARMLAEGSTPEQLARAIAELGPSTVIVKLAEKGALALVDGEIHEVSPVPVEVVDSVGAGDAFVGGYLAELLAGSSTERRLRTAAAAGAFACTVPGDWEGMPTRADLRSLTAGDNVDR